MGFPGRTLRLTRLSGQTLLVWGGSSGSHSRAQPTRTGQGLPPIVDPVTATSRLTQLALLARPGGSVAARWGKSRTQQQS